MRLTATLAFLAAFVAGCSEPSGEATPPKPAPHSSSSSASTSPRAPSGTTSDGGDLAGDLDAGTWNGPYAYALFAATPIMSDMDWPVRSDQLKPGERQRSIRIGYFRQGAKLAIFPEGHKKPNCPEGWYELVQGGFVCTRFATLDPNHPKIRNAPHPPDLSGPLPYDYGINLRNGTPMYKKLPSWAQRMRFEPWLNPHRVQRPRTDDTGDAVVAASATTVATTDSEDAGVPWYLRDFDGGKPDVTLEDLEESDPSGVIERRMIKGFYVSLDKDEKDFGAHWWKAIDGHYVPYERIYVPPMPTSFHGIWLNQDPPAEFNATTVDAGLPPLPTKRIDKLPIAFVIFKQRTFQPSDDGKKMVRGDWAQHFTVAPLTGERRSVDRQAYVETENGYWLREDLITITKPGPPPEGLKPGEKWIDINLKNETLVAFEGTTPVYATLISSGRRDLKEREKDHQTHNGSYRVREKHIAATMDADTASDGPYSIQDVPWIQYFNGSIALHGAFWHAEFGHVKSHGCVNLSPWDAKALFGWTDPQLPPGWHGVHATPEQPGTIVVTHDEAKPLYEDEDEDAGAE
ncbi:MAG: L,D-transpeptidase [Polyangiaceae bacterium]